MQRKKYILDGKPTDTKKKKKGKTKGFILASHSSIFYKYQQIEP